MTTNNITNKGNKNGRAAAVEKLIAGVKKHFPSADQQIPLGGATMTVGAITQQLQAYVDNRTAVVAAQATAKTKVATERAQIPNLDAFISAFRGFVKLAFGNQADSLADFGMTPPKARTPATAEEKAVAAAKRAATRAARGTKGPKAKQAVHGNVTATLVVKPGPEASAGTTPPAQEPATPAPQPAPAPAGATTQHS